MDLIDSDDPVLADVVGGLLEAIAEAGGWVSPEASIVAREGQLALRSRAADGEPLMRIPRAAMVPVRRIGWTLEDGLVLAETIPSEIDGLVRELLLLELAMLNHCGKVQSLERTHPAIAPDLGDEMLAAVRSIRPNFRQQQQDAVSMLWSTRCFRFPGPDGAHEPMLVPVLELMNHHSRGASTNLGDTEVSIGVRHPDGGKECFINYGWRRDAIGMAMVYGFADASADVAHSAPLDLEVEGVGRVEVAMRGRKSNGDFEAISASRGRNGTVLSRVSFGGEFTPVAGIARATGWNARQVDAVLHAVAEANLQRLAAIRAAASDPSPAERIFAEAAAIQVRVIESAAVR